MSILRAFAAEAFPKPVRQFAAPALLLIILLFFYVNGPIVFGALWTTTGFDRAILVYILFVLAGAALTPILFAKPPTAPIYLQLALYAVAAVILNVVILLSGARVAFAPTSGNYLAIVALQLAVSGAEELFFRGALYRTGPVISSAAFAAFHAVAYSGGGFVPIVFAFGAGVAFYFIYRATKDRYGLAINSGAHWGYNLGLLTVSLIPIGALFGGA